MKIFYDFEFIDDGRTIQPISVGMVRDDDATLYIINGDLDLDWLAKFPWLVANVVPHVPLRIRNGDIEWDSSRRDYMHVQPKGVMREIVRDFITHRENPELWGWFPSYDHVALMQLFGPMVDAPAGIPQRTNDLAQEAARLCDSHGLPVQASHKHHALYDAHWDRDVYQHLADNYGLGKV